MPKATDGKSTAVSKGESDASKTKDKLSRMIKVAQSMRRAHRDTDTSDAHSVTSSSRKISKAHSGSGFALKPLLHFQNTYKTSPEPGEEFNEIEIRRVCVRVLEDMLSGISYNSQSAPNLTRAISNVVKDKIKVLNMPRYKFIVTAIIGEKGGQCLKATSRCVWNTATDSWTSVEYINDSLFAVVTVHGVYMD